MDYITDEITKAYQSKRLQYIRADESDEHFKAFIPQIEQDPVIQVLAAPDMLQPKGKKQMDSYLESVTKSLLGVAVCLLPEATSDSVEQPVIIGVMCLGWGGIPQDVAHHRSAHIGISLAKPYQNKGYGREAINWMLDWAFKHAGLHSVAICSASFNPRGVHLYEDMGFVLEGRRRETIWFNRGWHDELEFGMTEREWEVLRGIKPM